MNRILPERYKNTSNAKKSKRYRMVHSKRKLEIGRYKTLFIEVKIMCFFFLKVFEGYTVFNRRWTT